MTVLGACGGGDESDLAASTNGGNLRSAEELIEARNREGAIVGQIGERYELGNGSAVIVKSIKRVSSGSGQWTPTHSVSLRVENTSAADLFSASVSIYCSEYDERGSSFFGSTYEPLVELPAGSFREGTIDLAPPSNDGVPKPCTDAVVRVGTGTDPFTVRGDNDDSVIINYPVPEFLPEEDRFRTRPWIDDD